MFPNVLSHALAAWLSLTLFSYFGLFCTLLLRTTIGGIIIAGSLLTGNLSLTTGKINNFLPMTNQQSLIRHLFQYIEGSGVVYPVPDGVNISLPHAFVGVLCYILLLTNEWC
jgi:hypothetical protein